MLSASPASLAFHSVICSQEAGECVSELHLKQQLNPQEHTTKVQLTSEHRSARSQPGAGHQRIDAQVSTKDRIK
jgi:hypothetical protein